MCIVIPLCPFLYLVIQKAKNINNAKYSFNIDNVYMLLLFSFDSTLRRTLTFSKAFIKRLFSYYGKKTWILILTCRSLYGCRHYAKIWPLKPFSIRCLQLSTVHESESSWLLKYFVLLKKITLPLSLSRTVNNIIGIQRRKRRRRENSFCSSNCKMSIITTAIAGTFIYHGMSEYKYGPHMEWELTFALVSSSPTQTKSK